MSPTTAEALRAVAEARGIVLTPEEAEAVLPAVLDLVREAERLTQDETYGSRDDGVLRPTVGVD